MLQIDIFVLLAQIVNFWILYLIFKNFIAQPLNARMRERAEQLKKLELADAHYEEKMQLAETQCQEIAAQAQKASRDLMHESEIIAKAKADAIRQKAHDEALAILDSGRREIEKERRTMLQQMKSHIVDISLRLNEKMFASEKSSKDFLETEFAKMK